MVMGSVAMLGMSGPLLTGEAAGGGVCAGGSADGEAIGMVIGPVAG